MPGQRAGIGNSANRRRRKGKGPNNRSPNPRSSW